jgi:DNA-binding beta-propeller fold protein YncE
VDGTLVAAHFSNPWTLAGDGRGHLYVLDGETIRAVDIAAGAVTTLAGVYGQPGHSDGVGAQASFWEPLGVLFDGGQLYVADTENHRLCKVDVQSASVTTIAGFSGVGAVDGNLQDAQFREPEGIVLDAARRMFIADTDNNTVRMIDLTSGTVTTVAGDPTLAGSTDGVGAAALFSKPRALAIDPSGGTIYVADFSNNRIRKIATDTLTVSTLVIFDAAPQGLAVDGSDVLVSLSDHRVARVAPDGTVTPLAGAAGAKGFVDGAGIDARFNSPAGLLDDGTGILYVIDAGNKAIRTIALADQMVATLAGAKSSGSADGAGRQARFSAPQGLAADEKVAYVADTGNDTIRTIALASGDVTTLAGAAGQPGLVDGALGNARFNQPRGLALDIAKQQLYIADTANRGIRRIDLGAHTVSTLTYAPVPGSKFDGFSAPSAIAIDQRRLFVTDASENVIVAIDLQRAEVSILAGQYGVAAPADGVGTTAGFYGPLGIAADGHGNLYVADDNGETIRKIEIATAAVSTMAGQWVMPGSSDGIGPAARFHYPTGLAADGVGDIFVSDLLNNTVRHIDVSSTEVTTVIGSTGVQGVLLGPLPAQLTQPSALALTFSGGLLVVSEDSVLIAH